MIYLDVDGVILPFGRAPDGPAYDEQILADGDSYDIADGIRPRLARLLELGEVVWATAWLQDAHLVAAALDLPCLEVVDYRDSKIPPILEHARGRRFVLIDDAPAWELSRCGMSEKDVEFAGGLLVAPRCELGLQDAELAVVTAFLRA